MSTPDNYTVKATITPPKVGISSPVKFLLRQRWRGAAPAVQKSEGQKPRLLPLFPGLCFCQRQLTTVTVSIASTATTAPGTGTSARSMFICGPATAAEHRKPDLGLATQCAWSPLEPGFVRGFPSPTPTIFVMEIWQPFRWGVDTPGIHGVA